MTVSDTWEFVIVPALIPAMPPAAPTVIFVSRARASVYLSRRAFAGDFDSVAERRDSGYRAFAAARYRASGVAAHELRRVNVEVFDFSAGADSAEDSGVGL